MNHVRSLAILIPIALVQYSNVAHGEPDDYAVHLAARGGANWSKWFRAEGMPGSFSSVFRTGVFTGLSSRLLSRFGSLQLGVQPEFSYSRKGTRLEASNGTSVGGFNLNYLDIPILGHARLTIDDRLYSYLVLGARYSILLNAEGVGVNGDVQDVSEFYDQLEFGLNAGIGIAIEVANRVSVEIEGRYDQGLTNVDNPSDNPGIRHRSFFLTLGVGWEVWRSTPVASTQSTAE